MVKDDRSGNRVELHLCFDGPINVNLQREEQDKILAALEQLEQKMSKELDALTAAVKRNSDAEDSAIALLQGLAAALIAAKDDPVKVQALADEVNEKANAMGAAVVANTPAGQ